MAERIARTATTLWTATNALIIALDDRLGPPIDSYLNGSQTWLTDDGPGAITVEWRLHPVASYEPPRGVSHYDILEVVVATLATRPDVSEFTLGEEIRTLATLWDGLECFAAHDDDPEPQTLATAVTEKLGIAPDRSGLVDHESVALAWEHSERAISIIDALRKQLDSP